MEGTELLTALKDTTPKMVKIILTGYPGLQNAVTAINKGADAYLIKPAKTEEMLQVIKKHLNKQKQERDYGQQKIAEYVENRLKELQTEDSYTSNKEGTEPLR
jgi:DNA-binding NtrC family response regulator